jgi:DNA-binding XRE family transcriptional regulator
MIDKENAYKVIRENAGATNEYIGKLLGVSEKTIRRYKKEINFVAPASTPQQEIDAVRQNTAYNNLKQKYNKLLQLLDEKDAALAQYESISEKPEDISLSVKKGKKREVVPVIVASDWHIEETVSAAITNGLNEYNLTIAEDSIKQFFDNACTNLVNLVITIFNVRNFVFPIWISIR